MMKVAVVVDDWKLEIFGKHLQKAGYAFQNVGPFVQGVSVLKIETDNPEALAEVLKKATEEAALSVNPTLH